MKRRGVIQREGNERETLHSVAPSRVENAALCWGSLCIREEVPGLKEKKALVRLRWRRFAAVKACSHEGERDRAVARDISRLFRRNSTDFFLTDHEEFLQWMHCFESSAPPPFSFLFWGA